MRALVIVTMLAGVAHANPAAEQLFRDGQDLIAKGKIEEACDRFARSEKLEPRVGTALNLGDCYERLGKTASAWEAFQEADAVASQLRDNRVAEAKRRAGALKPKLSYLTIEVQVERPTGFALTRNNAPLDAAEWNVAAPIDPGSYEVVASAPDHDSWSGTAVVVGGKRETIKVPALAKRAAAIVPTDKPDPAVPVVPPIVDGPPVRVRARVWSIGASAGETTDLDPIFGVRATRSIGAIRVVAQGRYDHFGDDSSNGFAKSHQFLIGGGAEYVWGTPKYALAVGAMAGLDLLFRNQGRGTDAAAFWGVRASPIIVKLAGGQVEAGLHLEGVQTTDRLAAFALFGIDWLVR